MDNVNVYVLTSLFIDADGNVASRNVGVTFDLFEAELHKSNGVENDFETFHIGSNWQEEVATTELVVMMRGFREMVEEMRAEALR
jgi:hypothetical protein